MGIPLLAYHLACDTNALLYYVFRTFKDKKEEYLGNFFKTRINNWMCFEKIYSKVCFYSSKLLQL